jgi:hypothetical protein
MPELPRKTLCAATSMQFAFSDGKMTPRYVPVNSWKQSGDFTESKDICGAVTKSCLQTSTCGFIRRYNFIIIAIKNIQSYPK